MTTEEEDPEYVKMKMYEAQAIVIEKEAEIEGLRRMIEEMKTDRQERNRGETSPSSRDVWEAIRNIQKSMEGTETQKLEETEIIKIIHERVTALEETDKFDQIERRLEEIVTRLETNEALNTRTLERVVTVEDRGKGGNETILIIGGERGGDKVDEIFILDRKTSTWKVLDLKLPCGNSFGGSVCLNDEIYIFGGNELKKKLYKLDSQQMRWIELAEMNEERENIDNSSLVFQGCIWVFGGWDLETVEKYCPERNAWIKMPGISEKRSLAAAAVCNGKIFVSGGYNDGILLKSVECFDPTSGVWTPTVDLPGGRWGHSMISNGSSLCVMGGGDGKTSINTVWRIFPSEENAIWKELKPMNEARRLFSAKSLCSTRGYKKEIFAIGGWNDKKTLKSVEIFDGERWRGGPKFPNVCKSMSSVVIPSSLAETLLQHMN